MGVKAQFIKVAVVSRAIAQLQGISEVLVHTGQHYDANMSDVFFDELDIPWSHHHWMWAAAPMAKTQAVCLKN